MSFFLGSWGMNRSAEQTNRSRTASRFTRFVCPALRFIPHEPRKKDTHSLNKKSNSANCLPHSNKFDLEIGQRSRSRHSGGMVPAEKACYKNHACRHFNVIINTSEDMSHVYLKFMCDRQKDEQNYGRTDGLMSYNAPPPTFAKAQETKSISVARKVEKR